MKHDMSKNMKIWLILAALVAVALLSAFLAITYGPSTSLWEPRIPKWVPEDFPDWESRLPNFPHGDIELFYTVKTVISSINATLLVILLITYINIYKKTRSEFTIGLIIFSMVLLLYALVSNPMMQWAFGFSAFGLGPFAMLPDLFTCVALAILLYLTVKY